MSKLTALYKKCTLNGCNFLMVLLRTAFYNLLGLNITIHHKAKIVGRKNIIVSGKLSVGMAYVGFKSRNDSTYINAQGKLEVDGNFSVGRGTRISVRNGAKLKLGNDGYITADTLIIAENSISIGHNCAISWGVQLLDDDFHSISYEGYYPKDSQIIIGNHVWIGSNALIFKGTKIPDDCVVAAGSVVRGEFKESGCLIAGNPAKVVKKNVEWN